MIIRSDKRVIEGEIKTIQYVIYTVAVDPYLTMPT